MLSFILLAIGFIVGVFFGVLLTCIVSVNNNKDDDFS